MNPQIEKLFTIANKPERLIIGLMSGTSLDGLDVALCRFRGKGLETQIELVAFETVSYDSEFKDEIKSVFSKQQVSLEKVCLLNPWVGLYHAELILKCLVKWRIDPTDIDLIASHGQTIYHAPKLLHGQQKFGNATLQIGDGDHIAHATGVVTLSDFRQKHIAGGGEGAPLAAYGDFLIFSKRDEDRIMLNIGGIANFTYLPGNLNADEVFCTDVGPGNTIMDAFIQQHFPHKYFDENAEVAKRGSLNSALLRELKDHPFFEQSFPKTTGPELFNLNYLDNAKKKSNTQQLSPEDTLATLNRFSADMIVEGIKKSTGDKTNIKLFSSGGGMHNPLLMENIISQLPGFSFLTTHDLHINPDAKEAVLFATLANECVCGGGVQYGSGRNGIPSVSMGKISFPN
ncbi:MAG: anhydro-N-acetylmuramic acid kinase [Cytophagales bacterium]|nr:anhydro-N-acetylmuramic acid kinase [Cytophagales bacterium]MCA6365971.1 anhydro-N-acetylmuramic acid kinase [Cytophagales bacterium]MCA6372438.1 anhydro-N-acetylmuramic acid kinase [Cytophagales bacterium]MCA6374848.1 anhydro-N-acetylmuramic acid kinase [Cytophagales bacterium]MCA6382844.1 anhydro-N-acetylmuramic acid kinase [Cytophagales bacterium]